MSSQMLPSPSGSLENSGIPKFQNFGIRRGRGSWGSMAYISDRAESFHVLSDVDRPFRTSREFRKSGISEILNSPGDSYGIRGRILRNLVRSGHIFPKLATTRQVLPNLAISCQFSPRIVEYCRILPNIAKYSQDLSDLDRSRRIFPNLATSCQMLRGLSKSPGNSKIPQFWNFRIPRKTVTEYVGKFPKYRQILTHLSKNLSKRAKPCRKMAISRQDLPNDVKSRRILPSPAKGFQVKPYRPNSCQIMSRLARCCPVLPNIQ